MNRKSFHRLKRCGFERLPAAAVTRQIRDYASLLGPSRGSSHVDQLILLNVPVAEDDLNLDLVAWTLSPSSLRSHLLT